MRYSEYRDRFSFSEQCELESGRSPQDLMGPGEYHERFSFQERTEFETGNDWRPY